MAVDKQAALGKFDELISQLMAKRMQSKPQDGKPMQEPNESPEHEATESTGEELMEHLTGQEAQDEPQDQESPAEDMQEPAEEAELPPHIQKLLEKALMMNKREPAGEINMGQIGARKPGGILIQKEAVKVLPKRPMK